MNYLRSNLAKHVCIKSTNAKNQRIPKWIIGWKTQQNKDVNFSQLDLLTNCKSNQTTSKFLNKYIKLDSTIYRRSQRNWTS